MIGSQVNKVPPSEIKSRLERLQPRLEAAGLDGVFIEQNVDLFYFSGTIQSSVLFVPAAGEALLMVRKSHQRATAESAVKDIAPLRAYGQIPGLVAERGHANLRRLGLELDVLPANRFLWYQTKFPRVRLVDFSEEIRRLRMIKSAYEVAQIKKAAAILDKGLREIRSYIHEGMTELEVDGYLAFIARREGHMGVMRMRGWNQEMTHAHVLCAESGCQVSFGDTPLGGPGNTPAMAQGAGFRRFSRNEPIGVDYGAGVNGYLADQFRTFVIGRLPRRLQKAHDCCLDIHLLFAQEARAGSAAADLYEMARREAKKAGLGEHFMGQGEGRVKFVGHGLGLEIDEYPIITNKSALVLEEGMVFALEPKFVLPGLGAVGLEDDYLVTTKGLERLTVTDQVVMIVNESSPATSCD